jgi:hypothetical protein
MLMKKIRHFMLMKGNILIPIFTDKEQAQRERKAINKYLGHI